MFLFKLYECCQSVLLPTSADINGQLPLSPSRCWWLVRSDTSFTHSAATLIHQLPLLPIALFTLTHIPSLHCIPRLRS